MVEIYLKKRQIISDTIKITLRDLIIVLALLSSDTSERPISQRCPLDGHQSTQNLQSSSYSTELALTYSLLHGGILNTFTHIRSFLQLNNK